MPRTTGRILHLIGDFHNPRSLPCSTCCWFFASQTPHSAWKDEEKNVGEWTSIHLPNLHFLYILLLLTSTPSKKKPHRGEHARKMLDYCLHFLFEVFSLKPPSKAIAYYLHLFGSFKLHSQPSHTARRMKVVEFGFTMANGILLFAEDFRFSNIFVGTFRATFYPHMTATWKRDFTCIHLLIATCLKVFNCCLYHLPFLHSSCHNLLDLT